MALRCVRVLTGKAVDTHDFGVFDCFSLSGLFTIYQRGRHFPPAPKRRKRLRHTSQPVTSSSDKNPAFTTRKCDSSALHHNFQVVNVVFLNILYHSNALFNSHCVSVGHVTWQAQPDHDAPQIAVDNSSIVALPCLDLVLLLVKHHRVPFRFKFVLLRALLCCTGKCRVTSNSSDKRPPPPHSGREEAQNKQWRHTHW